ncbi:endolytic transglycosylase MltG [Streptomyces sp. NPDC087850]|uniref:endolytic transglycosylase MltG n=1 Tax=Streptomyces sp. NPDC087850 TaxID=3365809 RepID=UPI00382B0606
MTDYGRGPGSEPWHQGDPLYGDQGWAPQPATDGRAPYGEQPQPQPQQQYPQQSQQQPRYGGGQDPYQQQYQQYDPQQQYADPQQHPQYVDPQQPQQYPPQQYAGDPQPYGTPPYGDQRPQQPQQYNDPQYNGGWDQGQQAEMPYGSTPSGPYVTPQGGYGENRDYYATPDAYPPPQPPGQRHAEPEPSAGQGPPQPPVQPESPSRRQAPAEPEPGDAEPGTAGPQQQETHPFFTGDDGRDDGAAGRDGEPAAGRGDGGGRERRGKTKKGGRNGVACLVVAVVLVGGGGGVSYFGYQFWQSKFGAPPDYAGEGSGDVQVEIPQGALGNEIGAILVKNGVVKSQRAFVAAQKENPKGNTIQAGVYTLGKGMSASNAVAKMLSPSSRNALIIPEGTRNSDIYKLIDKRLDIKDGETASIAKSQANKLGLPDWAPKPGDKEIKDPLEGFLFPASYPVAKGMKPEAILKKMVARANSEYDKQDLAAQARKLGLSSPLQVITVASLVQKEGKYKHDFDKVARVVYNRLKPDNMETVGRLEFDSTVNYLKGESKLQIGSVDNLRTIIDPYNTYNIKGLPPGPISNPGDDALHSALNPTPGPWYYFVSVTEDKTLFSVTNAEHEENRREYEKENNKQ